MQLLVSLLLMRVVLVGFLLLNVVWANAHSNITSVNDAQNLAPSNREIEVFVREGCPHCAKAADFLQALRLEQPKLNIVINDVGKSPVALERLQSIAKQFNSGTVRIPAFYVGGQLIIGYSDEITTGQLIRQALAQSNTPVTIVKPNTASSCEAEASLSCEADADEVIPETSFVINFMDRKLALADIGLPLFTLAMGLLDGFNPCSMWVLLLMISLLAPLQNRLRMFAIAGTFVLVEGIAYFIFMAAWMNLFLLIGLSRISEITIAVIALVAGIINLKDFWFLGWGVSLSIPKATKPGIYARMRRIMTAQNLFGALFGAVNISNIGANRRVYVYFWLSRAVYAYLTLSHLDKVDYYGYLLLYNLAYMFDDIIILSIGIIHP